MKHSCLTFRKWLFLGAGYSALHLAARYDLGTVYGTTRTRGDDLKNAGIIPIITDFQTVHPDILKAIASVDAVLVSVAPDDQGDPCLRLYQGALLASPTLQWVGYLSSTSVYGDHQGAMVTEDSPRLATSIRGVARIMAEDAWLAMSRDHGLPVSIFRLSGIYGSGRSVFDKLMTKRAQRLDKPGHLFSRIHGVDIAGVLAASLTRAPDVYNVCDTLPATGREVVEYACQISGYPLPPLIPFADATLSPMARGFYADHRVILPQKIQSFYDFVYPTYREGLQAIFRELHPRP
jgi:nucleoside-diphosphate-sugar epimerase